MIGMRYMVRTFLFIITIMLGWINMPAQAFLSPSDQNLWPVMSQNFDIPSSDIHKTDVQQQLDWDLRNPKYIHRLTVNARPFLFYVYQETKKYHVPPELALLPMIESGYVPDGRSSAGAVGLWQLMPGTADNFGIKMNYFYDGRQSTTVSTKAALHFLAYLYQEFNHNWLLALAAYNAGPGTVLEAIKYNQAHGRPTNFWSLPLPRQTEEYIPKLLALATIIQHPHAYGMNLEPVPDKAVTTTVKINKEMNLRTIADLAHTSVYTVKKLNPGIKHFVTPPHQIVTLVLPAGKKQTFVEHLAAHKKVEREIAEKSLGRYSVKKGDSLSSIAARFKTTIAKLEKINRLHNQIIRINQALLVPHLIEAVDRHVYHVVIHGDDLTKIARENHTTVAKLEQLNHMNSHSPLRIGEKLITHGNARQRIHKNVLAHKRNTTKKIAMKKHVVFSKHAKKVVDRNEHLYTVKRGDNLHRLAAEFNTTTYHIMQHNHLHTYVLQVGEHLELPNA